MKKTKIILVVVFFLFAVGELISVSPAQAASVKKIQKTETIRGKIISVDPAKNEVVVKDNKTGAEKTIAVAPKDSASLKVDEEVRITLKAGTNRAERIKKVVIIVSPTKKSGK